VALDLQNKKNYHKKKYKVHYTCVQYTGHIKKNYIHIHDIYMYVQYISYLLK
jgi:hypothetical protein